MEDTKPHRRCLLGSRRWVCAWWTLNSGATQRRADDFDFDPLDDTDEHWRVFPTEALAVAFAEKVEDYFGASQVFQQEFAELDRHSGLVIGSWDTIGERMDVVPLDRASGAQGETGGTSG
jgi:hypothetical protein